MTAILPLADAHRILAGRSVSSVRTPGDRTAERPGLSRDDLREFHRRFHVKSARRGTALAAFYAASAYAACLSIVLAFESLPWGVATLVGFALLLAAVRQMRAMENVVHFGSHRNFGGDRNDALTNLLSAWPVLQDVRTYRDFHVAHHGRFASHDDPCRARLERLGAHCEGIETGWDLVRAIVRWMPGYVREYYREVRSSRRQLLAFVGWHGAVGVAASVLLNPATALATFGVWLVAMLAALPFLRSIAEFGEHDYDRGSDVTATTFNNIGWVDHALLHPAGDAWHLLHHLHPSVPWWLQGPAHRFLMARDPDYRSALHRGEPIQGPFELPRRAVASTA